MRLFSPGPRTRKQLWCWISPGWSIIRLYAYYIPIWICIILSIIIYIAVGFYVFRRRNQLRNFEDPEPMRDCMNASLSGSESRISGDEVIFFFFLAPGA